MKFEFLWPRINEKLSKNNNSCVLKITDVNDRSALLTADIEKQVEKRLVANNFFNSLKSDVLLAPHHGSNSSSTANFIASVQAKYVIFTTAKYNRFSFPSKDVLKRYKCNDNCFNTANDGTIVADFKQEGVAVMGHREKYSKIWHVINRILK